MSGVTKVDTILVATDFSKAAQRAVAWAAQIGRPHGARLVLYHGVAPPIPPLVSPASEMLSNESQELERRNAYARLEEVAETLRRQETEIEVETDVQIDLGAEMILQRCEVHGADLIVAGTRGLGQVKKVLLGSTATQLIRKAPVPVVTVPPLAGPSRPIRHVLVPTDLFSDPQDTIRAIEKLLGTAAGGADLTLLHVHEAPYQPSSPWAAPLVLAPRNPTAVAAVRRLEDMAKRLEHRMHGIETVACGGDPARAIDREAQHVQADLIVMIHGRSTLSRLFRSSTAERVLAASPCPVLTLRNAPDSRASTVGESLASHAGPETRTLQCSYTS